MIIELSRDSSESVDVLDFAESSGLFSWKHSGSIFLLGSETAFETLLSKFSGAITASWRTEDNLNLLHADFTLTQKQFEVDELTLSPGEVPVVLGPCSIESKGQIDEVAAFIAGLGLRFIRGGAFKPRTNAYSFQGLGERGLAMMREAADRHGLLVVSETRDYTNVQMVKDYSDVVQIGAKAMFDYGVLEFLGSSEAPVLLKKSPGATFREMLNMGEYLALRGNLNLAFCERGIRTFEDASRFTLDLAGLQRFRRLTNRQVWVDPSHAMGERNGVSDLALGSFAAGADGLLIEMHPSPETAKSDSAQQITFNQAAKLVQKLRDLGPILEKRIV